MADLNLGIGLDTSEARQDLEDVRNEVTSTNANVNVGLNTQESGKEVDKFVKAVQDKFNNIAEKAKETSEATQASFEAISEKIKTSLETGAVFANIPNDVEKTTSEMKSSFDKATSLIRADFRDISSSIQQSIKAAESQISSSSSVIAKELSNAPQSAQDAFKTAATDMQKQIEAVSTDATRQARVINEKLKEVAAAAANSANSAEANAKYAAITEGLRNELAAVAQTAAQRVQEIQNNFRQLAENAARDATAAAQSVGNGVNQAINAANDSVDTGLSAFDKVLDGIFYRIGGSIVDNLQSALQGAINLAEQAFDKLVDLANQSVSLGASYEQSLAKVEAIFDTTTVSMDELDASIREISVNLGKSGEELSGAVYNLTTSSIEAADATEFLETSVKLATAGFTDSATSVDLLTTIINGYGKAASDAEDISNKLIVAQREGKTTIDELAASYGRVAVTAAQMNVSNEEALSAIAVLTSKGINTATATSSMNSFFTAVLKPSQQAKEAIESLGLSIEKDFSAAAIETKGLAGMMEDLEAALINSGKGKAEIDQLRSSILSNAEAMRFYNSMITQNGTVADKFYSTMMAMNDSAGMLNESFDTVTDTLQFDTQVLQSSLQALGLAFYDYVNEPLREVTQAASGYVQELIEAFQTGDIEVVVDKIAEIIENVTTKLQELLPEITPIMLHVSASIADGLVDIFSSTISSISDSIPDIIPVLNQLLSTVVDTVGNITLDIANALTDNMDEVVDVVFGVVSDLLNYLPRFTEVAIDLAAALISAVADNAQNFGRDVSDVVVDIIGNLDVNQIYDAVEDVIEGVFKFAEGMLENTPTLVYSVLGLLGKLIIKGTPLVLFPDIEEAIDAMIDNAVAYMNEGIENQDDAYIEIADRAAAERMAKKMAERLGGAYANRVDFLQEYLLDTMHKKGIWNINATVDELKEWGTNYGKATEEFADTIVESNEKAIQIIKTGVTLDDGSLSVKDFHDWELEVGVALDKATDPNERKRLEGELSSINAAIDNYIKHVNDIKWADDGSKAIVENWIDMREHLVEKYAEIEEDTEDFSQNIVETVELSEKELKKLEDERIKNLKTHFNIVNDITKEQNAKELSDLKILNDAKLQDVKDFYADKFLEFKRGIEKEEELRAEEWNYDVFTAAYKDAYALQRAAQQETHDAIIDNIDKALDIALDAERSIEDADDDTARSILDNLDAEYAAQLKVFEAADAAYRKQLNDAKALRDERLKAIDAELAALEAADLQDTIADEQKKLKELQENVDRWGSPSSLTLEERRRYYADVDALDAYKEELAKKDIQRTRDAEKAKLQEQKRAYEEEYKLEEERIKADIKANEEAIKATAASIKEQENQRYRIEQAVTEREYTDSIANIQELQKQAENAYKDLNDYKLSKLNEFQNAQIDAEKRANDEILDATKDLQSKQLELDKQLQKQQTGEGNAEELAYAQQQVAEAQERLIQAEEKYQKTLEGRKAFSEEDMLSFEEYQDYVKKEKEARDAVIEAAGSTEFAQSIAVQDAILEYRRNATDKAVEEEAAYWEVKYTDAAKKFGEVLKSETSAALQDAVIDATIKDAAKTAAQQGYMDTPIRTGAAIQVQQALETADVQARQGVPQIGTQNNYYEITQTNNFNVPVVTPDVVADEMRAQATYGIGAGI